LRLLIKIFQYEDIITYEKEPKINLIVVGRDCFIPYEYKVRILKEIEKEREE